ncbi:MAG: DUF5597 domain-containing protein [Acidobacteriota bacterium]|jgi:beta-galactosidase GanA
MRFKVWFRAIQITAAGLILTAAMPAMIGAQPSQAVSNDGTPRLIRQGETVQFMVDGSPLLIIGGELHNSSSSSLDYMEPIWQRMVDLNFNTVITPLSWELIEPSEGSFDFSLVDGLILGARRHGLRLIFLWFGSWKNGMSSYLPLWVKTDYQRFPRVKIGDGEAIEVLSTMAESSWQADAKAFAALMKHIRAFDGRDHTVLMMQIENEVGVLGDSRDRSEAANQAFSTPVPKALIDSLTAHKQELVPEVRQRWGAGGFKSQGSWEEIFGAGTATDEIFMAWHYARYIDHVAVAGKEQYDIPMYVNAWLGGPPAKPGDYPSGGPLPHVMDVWLAGAPHVDLLAPDIYAPNFAEWCQRYTQRGNPLFIPEMRNDATGARNVFYAIGEHAALGTSPFAVDSIEDPAESPLAASYAVLQQMVPLILEHRNGGDMAGFLLDKDHPTVIRELGRYELEISLDAVFSYQAQVGSGLIIAVGPDEFVGAGSGFRVSFRPLTPGPSLAGIGYVEEGTYRDGRWIPGRRLNGDENDQGRKWRSVSRKPGITRCRVYRYE